MTNHIDWLDDVPTSERGTFHDARFRIEDTSYVSTMEHRSKFSELCVKKPPALVEATVALLEQHQNANIVEFGISQGGSTALVEQIAKPRKLVALELSTEPVDILQSFIETKGCGDAVRPYYGVDQSDRSTIDRILDEEFHGEPIDLVLDDASHLLDETRASFEILFPRIRTGGLYIIEDWNWQHLRARYLDEGVRAGDSALRDAFQARFRDALADPSSPQHQAFTAWLTDNADTPDGPRTPAVAAGRPLTILVIELLVARARSGDAVSELTIDDFWVSVRRGPASLSPSGFRMTHIVQDSFGLVPRRPPD